MRGMTVCVALLGLVLAGCSHPPPPYESQYIPQVAPTYAPAPPIALPVNAEAVFIGDSWTQGYSATPESLGYAYLTEAAMGWTGPVYAASNTGYVTGSKDGEVPAYAERIASLPDDDAQIVVVQGSINDLDTRDWRGFPDIADQVIYTVKSKYPAAAVVLFGPCATSAPPNENLRTLDGLLVQAARRNVVHYVSCFQERWITDENVGDVIDFSTYHPSTQGHAYLADRLTKDLRAFITTPQG